MTSEEMLTRGLSVDDIIEDRKKAEELLQYVLSMASGEVDFVSHGDVLNVQMSVLNDGSVSLMISDDQNAAVRAIAEQLKEKLKEFSSVLTQTREKLIENGDSAKGKEKLIKYFINTKGSDNKVVDFDFWARLSSLQDCINMAKVLSRNNIENIKADLYKYYDDEYYICIHLSMSRLEMTRNLFTMSEYSDDVSSEASDYLMVCEHGKLLIKDNALKNLALI